MLVLLMAVAACTNPGGETADDSDAADESQDVAADTEEPQDLDEAASETEATDEATAAPTDEEDAGDGTQQVLRAASDDVETCTYDGEPIDLTEVTVGFSQSEAENNPFRIAETASIQDEASELGIDLIATNANTDLATQVADIQDMLAQGVEVLIVAPLNSQGLEPALDQAAEQGVPVITIDRQLESEPCEDYVTFIGSDFLEQGERAAEQMLEATGGEATVAILLGAPGNLVTTNRTDGFVNAVEGDEAVEIVAQQTGEFTREGGQQVTAQLIQANPDIDFIYAENDEMALGALQALRDAGRTPGEDIQIVSIDGTQEAVQAVVDGAIYAVVESNPRFGPLAFQVAQDYLNGEEIPSELLIEDAIYTRDNAEADLGNAY
jgi:ribose transport system substrate-binding protein